MVKNESPVVKYYSTDEACSCPDWHYRRRTRESPCKHVKRLQDARALLDAQEAYNLTKGIPRPLRTPSASGARRQPDTERLPSP